MPRYDYECKKCGVMELTHGFHDEIDKCPQCGVRKITKLISLPSFRMDHDWSAENGGKGRYISQVAERQNDPNAYFRSQREALEYVNKHGGTAEKA